MEGAAEQFEQLQRHAGEAAEQPVEDVKEQQQISCHGGALDSSAASLRQIVLSTLRATACSQRARSNTLKLPQSSPGRAARSNDTPEAQQESKWGAQQSSLSSCSDTPEMLQSSLWKTSRRSSKSAVMEALWTVVLFLSGGANCRQSETRVFVTAR